MYRGNNKMSLFEDLYKFNSKCHESQHERRVFLLEKQKNQRNKTADSIRTTLFNKVSFSEKQVLSQHQKTFSTHGIQLSEWMLEKPEDLANWFMVPCPKGQRCLIISVNGRSEAIDKKGKVIFSFRSNLPGGGKKFSKGLTIVDAFYIREKNIFYAIDLLAYGSQSFIDCECSFRFYWLNSKIEENELDNKNTYNFVPILPLKFIEMTDNDNISECLLQYPMFPENIPLLDGILFYHQQSSYVYGKSPLVLWLFPWMIIEMFNSYLIHQTYLLEKPENYQNYKAFIADFDVKFKKKFEKKSLIRPEDMDFIDNEMCTLESLNEFKAEIL